ncbi:hypothetical protein EBA05_16705 [Xanthomonas oryzae pv. oryzae]|nr:hypothetical protein C0L90_16650 [Xanthomonas oryzae pv. oryzae]QBI16912.1 hypothetical protein EYR03_16910 [Xanthomonas oryzae pv. oryzae]QBN24195.1 hypothetical protein EBA00_05970 [Xanthomonas oryzae pv. oryzae]QBN40222.1 hypothetical protein EBA04_16880 [Xanthomonas oryzae pv. oryzae]QBN43866.1 hypothetical protein EBA05_16705 [Xanthomonas oryzae pv. oryzae]
MICSSEKRFFTSNLLGLGNWTPSRCATQTWGDVDLKSIVALALRPESWWSSVMEQFNDGLL